MMRFPYAVLPLLLLLPLQATAQGRSDAVAIASKFEQIYPLQAAGHQAFANKDWARAAQIYRQYLALSPLTTTHTEVIRRLRKSERLLRQRSRLSTAVVYDGSTWGVTLIGAGREFMAMYAMVRGRPPIESLLPHDYEVSVSAPEGSTEWTESGLLGVGYRRTGELSRYDVLLSMGLTRKLLYPIWISAGVVGGIPTTLELVERRDITVRGWPEMDPALTPLEDKSIVFGGEAGLHLFMGSLSVHYHATHWRGEMRHSVGLGLRVFSKNEPFMR